MNLVGGTLSSFSWKCTQLEAAACKSGGLVRHSSFPFCARTALWFSWAGNRFGNYLCVDCANVACPSGRNPFIKAEFTGPMTKTFESKLVAASRGAVFYFPPMGETRGTLGRSVGSAFTARTLNFPIPIPSRCLSPSLPSSFEHSLDSRAEAGAEWPPAAVGACSSPSAGAHRHSTERPTAATPPRGSTRVEN